MVAIYAVEKNTNKIVAGTDKFTNVGEFHMKMVTYHNDETENFNDYLNDKFDWISSEGGNTFCVRNIDNETKVMTTITVYNVTEIYKVYDFTKASSWDAFLTTQGHEFEKEHGRYSWSPKKPEKKMPKPIKLFVLHRKVNTGDHGYWIFTVTGTDMADITAYIRNGFLDDELKPLGKIGATYFYDQDTQTAYVWDRDSRVPSFTKNYLVGLGKKELENLGMLQMSFGSWKQYETPAITKANDESKPSFIYAIDGNEVSKERYDAFVARATKTEAKKMTKEEIEKALGHPVVIVS